MMMITIIKTSNLLEVLPEERTVGIAASAAFLIYRQINK